MKDLTEGDETKLLIVFALPMLIGNVFQQFYNMVDSWVVGNYIGKESLAAVGASFPIIFLMISLVLGFSMGSNVIIAQYYGAKKMDKVRAAIDTTYIVLFCASIILTAFGLVAVVPILHILRVPDDIMGPASTYLRIIISGLILTFGYNGVGAILRGLGDSKTPLYMLIIATILNVFLDLLFVLGFGWGVAGAAWATVISQGVSFLGSLLYLDRTHEVLRTNFFKLRFDKEIFASCLKIGLPSGLQQTLVSLGLMFMSSVVNGFGTDVMAGFTAASRIDSFVAMPAMNIAMALSTFSGQNLGAEKPERVRRGFYAALLIGILITAFLVVGLLTAGEHLVGIFSTDGEVIRIGTQYLWVIAPFYFAFTIMFITNGVIRGAGAVFIPLLSTFVAMWLIRVPAAVLFSRLWGVIGVWWAMPTGWVVGMCISLIYYRSGRWIQKTVTKNA
ncbi:MAG: MATE family efflux transporter [Treponemataceae bacterium]